MMITVKLVTSSRKPTPQKPSTKRKKKRAGRAHTQLTYRDTFNSINATLAKHGTLSILLKQSTPTILTVNRPRLILLNNIMKTVKDSHHSLHLDLCKMDAQQRDAFDTRIIQTTEYRLTHTTPDAGKHAPPPTHSIEHHLIDTSHATSALAASINTPYCTDPLHLVYDRWKCILPPDTVFLKTDSSTTICRKDNLLRIMNASAVRLLR